MDTHENDPTALSPEDSIRVAEIRQALIAEMRESQDSNKDPSKYAINDVKELKADALAALRHTMRHSQNESLKSRVSMWAIDKIIEAEKADADDPMTEFLKGLGKETADSTTP